MKAPSFAYTKPGSIGEVFDLLDRHGDEAKLLAGGQSLLATLNMRLSSPALLIDIGNLPGLSGVTMSGGRLRIGALTTHRTLECSPEIAAHAPLLAQAAPHIAHVAIRNLGTIGGSIALADPAAEWPACCVALDAEFILSARGAERRVKAREFFRGLYDTALGRAELLTAIEVPVLGPDYRSCFLELARRHGDYAITGIAAVARVRDRQLSDVRLAFLGVGSVPVLARGAMAAVEGKAMGPDRVAAAQAALAADLDPVADLTNSAATKLHLSRVLLGRALAALAG